MGPLFVLGSGAAFGAMGIFGKLAYDQGATVGTLLSVRFAIAAALLWALEAARRERGRRGRRRRRQRGDVLAPLRARARRGLLRAPGRAVLRGAGADRRLAGRAADLYTAPAIVAVAAVVLGRERLDARRVAALVVASGGVVLVIGEAGALDPLGAALAIGAAVVYSAYILVSDGVARRLAAADARGTRVHRRGDHARRRRGARGRLPAGALTAAGWGWIACLAAVSTVGAIALFFAGLRRVGPTSASILSTVEPLATVVLAFLIFGETLGLLQLAGGTLVLAAAIERMTA